MSKFPNMLHDEWDAVSVQLAHDAVCKPDGIKHRANQPCPCGRSVALLCSSCGAFVFVAALSWLPPCVHLLDATQADPS